MSKATYNSHKLWTPAHKARLREMASEDKSTKTIAHDLGRTEEAVYSEASRLHVSLKPKDG